MLPIIILLVLAVPAIIVNSFVENKKLFLATIIPFSIIIAGLHFWIALGQKSDLGLAASMRTPKPWAQYIGFVVALGTLINLQQATRYPKLCATLFTMSLVFFFFLLQALWT